MQVLGAPFSVAEQLESASVYLVKFTLEQTTIALEGGGWSTPRPGRFTPRKESVPIVWEAEWAPGPVWRGAENLGSAVG